MISFGNDHHLRYRRYRLYLFFFNWEQSILLQQGKKRGEITGNKIGLPMEYCGHYGGT